MKTGVVVSAEQNLRVAQTDGQCRFVGRVLLCAAILSGAGLMWPLLNAGPLALDEQGSYWIIDSDLPGNSLERSLNYAAIPPLSGWLQAAFLWVFGKSEWAFRLPSAVCYLGAILVTYFWGSRVQDQLTGAVAAMLVAWHPEGMDEVRIARCYGLVLLLSSLVMWSTLRWLQAVRDWRRMLLWMASAAALLWTHYVSALLVFLSATTVLFAAVRSPGRLRSTSLAVWLTGMLCISLLGAPLIPSVLRLQSWGPNLNYMSANQSLFSVVGPVWWLGLPLAWLVSRIVARLQTSSTRLPVSGDHHIGLLLTCSVVPLLLLAVLAAGDLSSLANPRYRVTFVPAGACLLACWIRGGRSTVVSMVTGMIVLLVSVWLVTPQRPWQLGRLQDPADLQWRQLTRDLEAHSQQGEPLFVQSGLVESGLIPIFLQDRQFHEYVACRVSRFYLPEYHPRYGLPSLWTGPNHVHEYYHSIVNSIPAPLNSFWIAAATDTDLNRNSLAEMQQVAADAGFHLTWQRIRERATLQRFTRTVEESP